MMKYILMIAALAISISCSGQNNKTIGIDKTVTKSESRHITTDVPIVNFESLKKIIEENKNKLLVINFWATWCKPCIEELPEFLEVNDKYKDYTDYKMILVSLDQVKNIGGVKKFIEKTRIDTEVYLLDDNKKMNIWIPETSPSWSGAIPATVFYKNGKRVHFEEGAIEKQKLESIISDNYKL